MAINVKDKLVTVESLGIAYSTEKGARQEADQALSTRIDNIVAPDGDPSLTEVSDARVSGSTTYPTLKARLDADKEAIGTEISQLSADLEDLDERLDGLDIDVTTEKIVDSAVTWEKLAGDVKSRISANTGISEQAVTLLVAILRTALYSTDQSANIDLLEEALLSGNTDVIYQSGETLTINALAIDPYQDGNVLNIE